jgi:hypothetical protein
MRGDGLRPGASGFGMPGVGVSSGFPGIAAIAGETNVILIGSGMP